MEELIIMGPKDINNNPTNLTTHIVKGKRTKRQRPQSPIPFTIPTATASSTAEGGDDNDNEPNPLPNPSPSTSGDGHQTPPGTAPTEEEEDMANCLILLAQGHAREYQDLKFSSKKYVENSNGKLGFYVYECKTCSRTFPSFQALGGHRASHKKPKIGAAATAGLAENKRILGFNYDEYENEDDELIMMKKEANSSSLSLQLMTSNKAPVYGLVAGNNKFKVHECSICGAEFSSGQALGGHMRRHRSANITALSLSPIDTTVTSFGGLVNEEDKKIKNVLSLDLNLPAPSEDHDQNLREPKFGFLEKQKKNQKQQQQQQDQPLVLSTPPRPLVDCHY